MTVKKKSTEKKTGRLQVVSAGADTRKQFKCRSCEKRQSCYGSRYCQNEFNPVSVVTLKKNGR
jgi:uncharacterized protein CbrC (UPF0167 family)